MRSEHIASAKLGYKGILVSQRFNLRKLMALLGGPSESRELNPSSL